MKKLMAILILIGVIVYNGRDMLSLGYNYITWKPSIESEETVGETVENPLEKYIEALTKEPDALKESVESPRADDSAPSSQTPTPTFQYDSIQPQQINNSMPSNAIPNKPTVISIAAEYNIKLKELEDQFRQSLDGLIETALADYNSGKYSKLDLAAVYLKKGEELEKSSDERFYSLLSSLKSELSANGFEATLVTEIDQYYISMKKTEKARILNKGMELVESKRNRP